MARVGRERASAGGISLRVCKDWPQGPAISNKRVLLIVIPRRDHERKPPAFA